MSEPSSLPPGELFAAAIARQRAGDRNGAEALCRQLLAVQPDHADALHLLGLVLSQNGQHTEAVAVLR